MEKIVFRELSKEEKRTFYQSKYDYYRTFNLCMAIVSVLAYLSYFFTDCGIFGRFAHETLLSRIIIIIPFAIFIVLQKKVKDYRIMVPATYLLIHCIIWCTDWATYLLPDRQHAISGMIIMNLIFMCAGFAAPFSYSLVGHCLLIADIALANTFLHYENLDMMYMFNIPAVVAVVFKVLINIPYQKRGFFKTLFFMCVFIKVLIAEDSCEQSVYRFLYALRLYAGVVNYKRMFFSIFFIMKIFA